MSKLKTIEDILKNMKLIGDDKLRRDYVQASPDDSTAILGCLTRRQRSYSYKGNDIFLELDGDILHANINGLYIGSIDSKERLRSLVKEWIK